MTPEAFEKLVTRGDIERLVAGVADLTDKQRRALSKTSATLYRKIIRGDLKLGKSTHGHSSAVGSLAALAVCPLSTLKRVELWSHWKQEDSILRVLTDRRPDWVGEWVEHKLDQEFSGLSWRIIQELRNRGLCDKPTSAGYIRMMVNHFMVWPPHVEAVAVPLSKRLVEEPEILAQDVWRLFEVENAAFTSDWYANEKNLAEGYETWGDALVKLCASGHIDRHRMLDASLSALWITTNSNMLTGYRRLHEALVPNTSEVAARQMRYRELLGHKTPHIVGFALKQLKKLAGDDSLDVGELFAAMLPVFSLKPKSHPCAAVRLAKKAWCGRAEYRAAVVELAAEALRHPALDTQELAVDLLEEIAAGDFTIELPFDEVYAGLAAGLRTRIAALTGESTQREEDVSTESRTDATLDNAGEVFSALHCIPPEVRSAFGIDSSVASDLESRLPGEPTWRIQDVAVLEGLDSVEPIRGLDELIDTVAHAIEIVDSADELERIIAGVCRLCGKRPPDFSARIEPLMHRIEKRGGEGSQGLGALGSPPALMDLIATWITGKFCDTPVADWVKFLGPSRFMQLRVKELVARVAGKRAFQPLSAPTHRNGWIDPRVLVERVLAMTMAGDDPLDTDSVQALLRIAPDHRAEALEVALGSDLGRLGGPLCWAIGGREGPSSKDRSLRHLWVAAARARQPLSDATADLKPLELPTDWPDVLTPAKVEWRATIKSHEAYGKTYTTPDLKLQREPPFPSMSSGLGGVFARVRTVISRAGRAPSIKDEVCPELNLYPTALMHEQPGKWWNSLAVQTSWLIDWQVMLWPSNPQSFYARGARALMSRFDMDGSNLEPNFAFLNPLFERYRPLDEPGVLLLWLGLFSKDADVRRLAIDATIETIADGRVAPQLLAGVLARLATGGWGKLNRVAEVGREVAGVSHAHKLVIGEAVAALLTAGDELSRGSHLLLELLHEIQVTLGRPMSPELRDLLESVQGKSKAAKLARALLKDAPEQPGTAFRAAISEMWRSRGDLARDLGLAKRQQ